MIITSDLVHMMFRSEPIKDFEALYNQYENELRWGALLRMCYWEHSFASCGGDSGDLDDPPIDHKRLAYLEKLIDFLEGKGIQEETR